MLNRRKSKLIVFLIGTSALAGPAFGQTLSATSAPARETVDANSIDVQTGLYSAPSQQIRIGGTVDGIGVSRYMHGGNYTDDVIGTAAFNGSNLITVIYGGRTEHFDLTPSGAYQSREGLPHTLSFDGNNVTMVDEEGTTLYFGYSLLNSIVYANGKRLDYYYRSKTAGGSSAVRIQSIKSNTGYHLKFSYQSDDVSYANDLTKWTNAITETAINDLVDPCDVNTNYCNTPYGKYPHFSNGNYSTTGQSFTDSEGNTTYSTIGDFDQPTAIKLPGSAVNNITMTSGGYIYDHHTVTQVTNNRGATSYSYSLDSNNVATVTSSRNGLSRQYVTDIPKSELKSSSDELGRNTSFSYNSRQQVVSITHPELDWDEFQYNDRGDLITTIIHPKPNSTLAAIVTSASYSCAIAVHCHKPDATIDARNQQTDYTYDPVHGGVLTITGPAATPGGVRPQVRYTYERRDAFGNPSDNGVAVVHTISTCRTQSTCGGSADELLTTYTYGRNLLVTSVTKASGDGQVSSTSSYAYDDIGNVVSTDGPLPGAADTAYMEYSSGRHAVALITSGPTGMVATRTTYNPFEAPMKIETGTVAGTTMSDVANMSVRQTRDISYDLMGRKIQDATSGTAGTVGVTQYSYDALGRLDCATVRMNGFGGLPDACTATSGNSQDRIIRVTGYDALDRATAVTNGYGTAAVATEQESYTPNGRTQDVTDANNNVTTFGYDGFDRQTTITLPGGSYEQVGLEPGGSVTSRRLRDGQVIGYTLDLLGRPIYEDNPNSNVAEVDVGYSYDNWGNLIRAQDQNGWFNAFEFDALGRSTRAYSNVGDNRLRYNASGQLVREDWGDGFFVTYDRDGTGAMQAVRENGGFVLASYGYDDLGRLQTVSRGNGAVSTYGYDAAGRLGTLGLDLAGTAQDVSYGFTYNSAGQIGARTRSNDTYVWTGPAGINRSYAVNALNQYTSAGATGLAYEDGRGNLTRSGGDTYQYNTKNYLTFNSAGQLFYHNPVGLLGQQAGQINLDWVGNHLVQESSNGVNRRYVYGAESGVPLVWYEGAGTNDRRWLMTDERDSVVAVTDGNGNALTVNRYDEYGVPQPTDTNSGTGNANLGRFQYAGQMWIPELSMYDAQARTYSPTLGRFMQTDPIGYGDGLNWYNYTHGDPVNSVDPFGLQDGQAGSPPPPQNIQVDGEIVHYPGESTFYGADHGVAYSNVEAATRAVRQVTDVVVNGVRKHKEGLLVAGAVVVAVGCPECDVIAAVAEAGEEEEVVVTAARNSRGWLGRLIDRVFKPSSCFAAGTLVPTSHGLRRIETIQPGDLVLSRDEKTGHTAYQRVTAVKVPTSDEIYALELDVSGAGTAVHQSDFKVTANHPWRTTDGRWVRTADLNPGTRLVRADGAPATVDWVRDTHAKAATYNLTVAEFHTYFVGKDRLWVHNACPAGMRDANMKELRSLAERNGFKTVEDFKTQELQLTSRHQIAVNRDGEMFSYPRQGEGVADPLGININD